MYNSTIVIMTDNIQLNKIKRLNMSKKTESKIIPRNNMTTEERLRWLQQLSIRSKNRQKTIDNLYTQLQKKFPEVLDVNK